MHGIKAGKRAALVACLIVCGTAGAASAATPPAPEALVLSALIGPDSTKLFIEPPAGVTTFEHVHVEIRAPEASNEHPNRIINLTEVAAPEGLATVDLGNAGRGAAVRVNVHIVEQNPPRTVIHRGETIVKLRPDLAVTAVYAPPQTLSTRAIDVRAEISELNLETGARARVKLMLGPSFAAEPKSVTVPVAGTLSVVFEDVKLSSPATTELTVVVDGADPRESDGTNNTGATTVEVTEHELVLSNVLFPSLGGYGTQFNHHLYAPITARLMPPGAYDDVETKVRELQPQLVRIFYNDNWAENYDRTHPEWPENYASFVEVVRLAQETGATINITYQTLANMTRTDSRRRTPAEAMAKFADALEDLIVTHQLTNVRWATVGNEPNSGAVALEHYYTMYRALHAELVARGLDDQIKLMGGDLIELAGNPERNHYTWLKAIAQNLGDILGGYSEHAYWWYDDAGRLEYRLRDTHNLVNAGLPPEQHKPVYMMEFGVRGYDACGTKPRIVNLHRYYRDDDCTEIWRTNIAGFQQLWFAIGSGQLGYAGAAKWDAYWAVYDRNSLNQQAYWMTGPPSEGYPLTPTYHAMSLLFHVTVPGWQIIQVRPWDSSDSSVPTYGIEGHVSNDQPEKELVGYAGDGEYTIVGLDTNGRSLNAASSGPAPTYSIGGLPAHTEFNLVLWNASGDGTNSLAENIQTGSAGVARFEVPLHAAFALTTVPGS